MRKQHQKGERMTDNSTEALANPEEARVEGVQPATVSETVQAEDPNAGYRKIQSEKDRLAAELEKARKAQEFWQEKASVAMSQEQREAALLAEKAEREAEERARLEQELQRRDTQATLDRLVSDKYPHLKGEDLLQNVSGSPEEIELQLKQVDEFVRRTQSRLAKEESAKKTAQGVSPAAAPASAADLTVEEYRQMDPNTKQKVMFEKQREWLKSLRENM